MDGWMDVGREGVRAGGVRVRLEGRGGRRESGVLLLVMDGLSASSSSSSSSSSPGR